MDEPVVENPLPLSLLIADRVYQDRETGKWIVSGVFSDINVGSVPYVHDHLEVFFQVTNISAPVELRLRLEHADGDVLVDIGGPINLEDPLQVVARRLILRRLPFNKAGKHWLMLKTGETILTQVPLQVHVRQQSQQQRRRRGEFGPEE